MNSFKSAASTATANAETTMDANSQRNLAARVTKLRA